jgi:hypothetical protein
MTTNVVTPLRTRPTRYHGILPHGGVLPHGAIGFSPSLVSAIFREALSPSFLKRYVPFVLQSWPCGQFRIHPPREGRQRAPASWRGGVGSDLPGRLTPRSSRRPCPIFQDPVVIFPASDMESSVQRFLGFEVPSQDQVDRI